MPFKIGPAPIRRTAAYLNRGKLIFKDRVKILAIHYNDEGEHHQGARDFVFWDVCHIQYKNPNLQIVTLTNRFPTPFMRLWFDNGQDITVDVFGKNNLQILDHLIKILGKTTEQLDKEKEMKDVKLNPANFGSGYDRHCICEIQGQVPCPTTVNLPKHMTLKYKIEQGLVKDMKGKFNL